MTSRRVIYIAAALAAIMLSAGASAQPQRGGRGQGQPPGPGPAAGPAGCAPSGFMRLTRNCSQNVGNCQRMPDSCNRGWCCP